MKNKDYGKVLGELETQIMEVVWQAQNPVSVSDVLKVISKKRTIAYTTIMTVMSRLTEKGLLKQKNNGKAYTYLPTYSKDTFLSRISRQFIKNFVASFGDTAIAHFAEELDKIPTDKKKKLLAMLGEKEKKS